MLNGQFINVHLLSLIGMVTLLGNILKQREYNKEIKSKRKFSKLRVDIT